MRSHTYRDASQLPPVIDGFPSAAPNHTPQHSQDDIDVPLSLLDPDTSQLLPVKKRQHRVRVQGHLAVVKSVSTVKVRPPLSPGLPTGSTSSPSTPRFESGVAGSTLVSPRRGRRRRSMDDGTCSDTEEDDHRETAVRDRQFRGYGIGGAGNIRRPTEVIHGPRPPNSPSRLLMYSSSSQGSGADKRWWSLRQMLGRRGDRKGKTREM